MNFLSKFREATLSAVAFIALLCSGWVAGVVNSDQNNSKEVQNRLERVINGLLPETALKNRYGNPAQLANRMAYYHTPGVSIAVINNYQIEWAKGFGVLEKGKIAPVTDKTLFQAGSISKPVFALAIMKLVQEGKLSLDQDVNHYLTSWKVPPNGTWQPRITLRQILSHSAGLTVHGFPGYLAGSKLPSLVNILNGEAPSNTVPIRVNILPGTQFRYSGGGTAVAQQLVVDVLHKPFPKIMNDLILAPIGLKDSTYEQPLPSNRIRQAATGHPEGGHPVQGKWHVYPEMAAAGLWTTPSDLAAVGIELQMAQKGDTKRLLQPNTVTQMLSPGIDERIGIGFFLSGKDKDIRFSHDGWDEGFVALVNFYKNTGKGVVIMINSNEGFPLLGEIERAIAREYEWPGYFAQERKPIILDRKILNSLVGDYKTKSGINYEITEANEKLFLDLKGQTSIELIPESDNKFFIADLNTEVTIDKLPDGPVKGLTIQQDGGPISAERK